MTTRVLPRAEWPRLATHAIGPALATAAERDDVTVLVAECDGALVGAWTLLLIPHVEGLWAAEPRVLWRLWNAMRRLCADRGIHAVWTGAVTETVRDLLETRGAVSLPPMYAVPLDRVRT